MCGYSLAGGDRAEHGSASRAKDQQLERLYEDATTRAEAKGDFRAAL